MNINTLARRGERAATCELLKGVRTARLGVAARNNDSVDVNELNGHH
jgi:hypothetical protein